MEQPLTAGDRPKAPSGRTGWRRFRPASEAVKAFFRAPPVRAATAWLLASYLRLTLASMRWRFENREPVDVAAAAPEGVIGCFWHGCIGLAPVVGPLMQDKPRRVLISPSPDGEFIARVVGRLGFPALRGTSALTDKRRFLAGAFTFHDAMKFILAGGVIVITPDGPRGPAQVMPVGPVAMARVRGTKVFLCGLAASRVIALKSWDRTRIPLPFARGCAVFVGPLTVPKVSGEAAIEAVRLDWQTQLNAAQARAEALVRQA